MIFFISGTVILIFYFETNCNVQNYLLCLLFVIVCFILELSMHEIGLQAMGCPSLVYIVKVGKIVEV